MIGQHKRKGIRVLVIDDDRMLRDLLVESLNQYGYRAFPVENPDRAAEMVALYGAQIVLCDIKMPGVDGLEVTRRLKERDGGTQVILMTGYPDRDTVDDAFHLGADGYLIKPFPSLQVVFEAIDAAGERLRQWNETLRDAIRKDFPQEFQIIYDGETYVPSAEEVEHLIEEAGFDSGRDSAASAS